MMKWNLVMKNVFVLLAASAVWLCVASSAWAGGIPVYGKWCGPGHGFKGPPIDAVDQVCKVHDYCCRKTVRNRKIKKIVHGIQFCHCDRPVVRNMPRAIRQTKSKKGKRMGKVIYNYFKRTACLCTKRVCLTVPKCKKVKKCKKIAGKKRCVKVPKCTKKRVCKSIQVMGRGGKCPAGSK